MIVELNAVVLIPCFMGKNEFFVFVLNTQKKAATIPYSLNDLDPDNIDKYRPKKDNFE